VRKWFLCLIFLVIPDSTNPFESDPPRRTFLMQALRPDGMLEIIQMDGTDRDYVLRFINGYRGLRVMSIETK
jgi:hypothetical protein